MKRFLKCLPAHLAAFLIALRSFLILHLEKVLTNACLVHSEIMTTVNKIEEKIQTGLDPADAWNEQSVDLLRCAKVCVISILQR